MSAKELATTKRAVRVLAKLQPPIYRLTGGRVWASYSGYPVCLVTMTGAKTGRRRIIPLMYVRYGKEDEGAVLVASLGGAPESPVWYHNLLANPEVEVQIGNRKRKLRARLVEGEERAAAWAACTTQYPPYQSYQGRTDRVIPVFVCEPREG
jgi:deazaflavin-dependent oxidoreductase (nitroreductase family)